MNEKKPGRICAPFALAGIFAALILGFGVGAPAFAQDGQQVGVGKAGSQPKWSKRCKDAAGAECEISFGAYLDIGDSKVWVSSAGVYYRGNDKRLFIYSQLGTLLPRGLSFRIDTSEPKRTAFFSCAQLNGCQSLIDVDDKMIAQLKAGSELQAQWVMANGERGGRSVSLSGFTAAYDGPPEEVVTAAKKSGDGATPAAPAAATSSGGKGDAVAQ